MHPGHKFVQRLLKMFLRFYVKNSTKERMEMTKVKECII